jgi:GNAT superfamily N-acetyltransferase
MKNEIKVPETDYEIKKCHNIREYVLKESFADEGLDFKNYDSRHEVHQRPNISLVFIHNEEVIGSVRLDKKFEHISFKAGELRLALFGIDPLYQGKGLGKLFFEGVIDWCSGNSISKIYTNSRMSSHLFWTKMGFQDKKWDNELDCETEIQMILQLNNKKDE